MGQPNEVFEKTYTHYLSLLADADLGGIALRLGIPFDDGEMTIMLSGEGYRVSKGGIRSCDGKRAGFAQSIVLFKYLLMLPDEIPEPSGWVAYHTFKDAQPLRQNYSLQTNARIAEYFSGKLVELELAGKRLGGEIVADDASFDVSMQFTLLPKIPLFLRFNDADEDFESECTTLFDQTIESYLDMESVSILGSLFAHKLTRDTGATADDN
ncbi:DUF3786 domain-containing protein [Desulfopila sp. IMCC35008]|uniref:DUF3786 domain-containing protein n=1 Tax=Desulfopila sp. IMCC35008 TaxID=2653858 RepID=UPI0013D3E312|nr:DUF3786 domain-containing protein [Desulfopila sp. IMCC35008]